VRDDALMRGEMSLDNIGKPTLCGLRCVSKDRRFAPLSRKR
jgi:hypothetical protein